MKIRCHRVVSLGVLGVALAVLGCKPPPSKRQFINHIAESNQRLALPALRFRKALFPPDLAGGEFDPGKVDRQTLKAAWDEMDGELRKVRTRYEDEDLPRNSSRASDLKSAYDDYLTAQAKILDKAKDIISVLEDPKVQAGAKKDQVGKLLSEIAKIDGDALGAVTKAQQGYAEAHNFKLVNKLD
jgi:hypothetical protein